MRVPDGYTIAEFINWLRHRVRSILQNSSFPIERFDAKYLSDLADEIVSEAVVRAEGKRAEVRYPFLYYSRFLSLIVKERTREAYKDIKGRIPLSDSSAPGEIEVEPVAERIRDPKPTAEQVLVMRDEIEHQCELIIQEMPVLVSDLISAGKDKDEIAGFSLFVDAAIQAVVSGQLSLRGTYRQLARKSVSLPPLSTCLRWWTKDLGIRVHRARIREELERRQRSGSTKERRGDE